MDRLRVALLVAVVWSALAPSSGAQTSYEVEDLVIRADDGEPLAARLWTPRLPGLHAAVLLAHGFGGSRDDFANLSLRYVEAGYVALAWDARGFGGSGGRIELNGPKEVADVSTLVSFLATRPEVLLDAPGDPRVAMRGGSYGGAIQLLAAANDARIDAIVPMITWNDLRYSLYPNEVLKQGWTAAYYAIGTASGHGATGANPNAGGMDPRLTEGFARTMATNDVPPETLDLLAERAPARVLDRVRTPTLLVQGWFDTLFTINEAARTFEALTARGVPAKLLLYGGGHGYDEVLSQVQREEREAKIDAWLAYWLKGSGSAEDLFALPVQSWDEAAKRWNPEQAWPPTDLQDVPLHLALDAGGNGQLASAPPTSPTRTLLGSGGLTSYSELPYLQSRLPTSSQETPATSFAYRSEPWPHEARFLGEPRLRLWASTTSPDATLFFKLYDESSTGALRLLDNQVTPLRLRGADPQLENPKAYEIPLTAVRDAFAPGHRLRLVVATSDAAYGSGRNPGAVGVFHDAARPSRLDLPLLPSERALDQLPPVISDIRAAAEGIRARITDDVGVARAHLAYFAAGRESVVGGVPLEPGEFSFDLPPETLAAASYQLLASDAAGNRATLGVLTGIPPAATSGGAETPGPSLLAFGLATLAALAVGRRRAQSTAEPGFQFA